MVRTYRLRSFILACAVLSCFSAPFHYAYAATAESTYTTHDERESYAKDFVQSVISILHDPVKSYGDRKNTLRRAFIEALNVDWMAKFVLGKAWRVATAEQQEEFTGLYRQFLTETYVTHFADNPSKSIYSIKILGVNDEGNEFTVRTQMQLMTKETLMVDYRVQEEDRHYKVVDIIIENVSMIQTHRTEFTALADTAGVDGVITRLQEQLGDSKDSFKISMK